MTAYLVCGVIGPASGAATSPSSYPLAFQSLSAQNSVALYPRDAKSSAAREPRPPPFQKKTRRTSLGMSAILDSS